MRIRHLFALVVAMLFACAAQAQIHSSSNSKITKERVFDTNNYNRISLGFSMFVSKIEVNSDLNTYRFHGGELDYVRGINLTKKAPVFLEVGGRVTYDMYKTIKSEVESQEISLSRSFLALSVPVSFTYKATFGNGFYLAPYLGPHLRVNILGQDKLAYKIQQNGVDEVDVEEKYGLFDNDATDPTFKHIQFGAQGGLNLGYKRVNIGVGYYFDSPIYKLENKSMLMHGLSASVGINF